MRTPGFLAEPTAALDEAVEQLKSCPVCHEELKPTIMVRNRNVLWRARECSTHGWFVVKWFAGQKRVSVEWIFDRYLDDIPK